MDFRTGIAALAALSLSICAWPAASAGEDCMPTVEDAWVRSPPMRMPMMAGFARIANACDASVAVVAAHSSAFGAIELHETTTVDGMSRMRQVPVLEIVAGETAVLRPGGLHLMLMDPQGETEVGDTLTIAFELDDGRRFQAAFEVRSAASR